MEHPSKLIMQAIPDLPVIREGDDLSLILQEGLTKSGITMENGDILVIAHKVVSKAEGRVVSLDAVTPSKEALDLARETHKDPAKIELILRESRKILRVKPPYKGRESVLICLHRSGMIMANAGVDESNTPGERTVVLLPDDPDHSARSLRSGLAVRTGIKPGVIISDSFGRPWRKGLVNVAIGLAGVPGMVDLTGTSDIHGKQLRATIPAFADETAAAAGLLMQKSGKSPAVLIKGLLWKEADCTALDLLRPETEDLFR